MAKAVVDKDETVVESIKIPTVEDMTSFIKNELDVPDGQRMIVRHLWGKNFRTKVYAPIKRENSALTFEDMVDSKFVSVQIGKRGRMELVIVE